MPSPDSNEEYDHSRPWWDQPKSFARGYWLRPPYDRIMVGCDPRDGMTREFAQQFDAIVNVSSTKCVTFEPARPDQRTYWFPIIELGRWPVVYLLWLKEVLDFHYKAGHKVYLHCHAGAFRSPSAALLWLESRGHSKVEQLYYEKSTTDGTMRIQANHGNLPKRKDKVFQLFRDQEREYAARGRAGELCIESLLTYTDFDPWDEEVISGSVRWEHIKRHYLWFWYGPKWWAKGKWSLLKAWALKREGYVGVKGSGSHHYRRARFWSRMAFAEPLVTDTYGSRMQGDFSWIEGRWHQVKFWSRDQDGKYSTKWLRDPCPKCEGRSSIFHGWDAKPTHSHCEECKRTGVKLG